MTSSTIRTVQRDLIDLAPEIRELIPAFFKRRDEDLKKLTNALAIGDFASIRAIGHQMRGSAGAFGFEAVADIGHSLEVAAEGADSNEAKRLFDELRIHLKDARKACG